MPSDEVLPEGGRPGRGQLSRRGFLRSTLSGAGLLAAGAALEACGSNNSSATSSTTSTTTASNAPKRGGNLRVAMVGGTPADTLDADDEINFPEVMRNFALYNGLVSLDANCKTISMDLAEEMIPSPDARTWTIRLRPGVTFHNGKPLTAEDVVYTFSRIINPKAPHNGAAALPTSPGQMKVLDAHTARVTFDIPYATFLEQISLNYYFGIVPVGYDPKKAIGTGPFKLQSFTPGVQSVFVRNPNYYKPGLPYLDELTVIDSFQDSTAAFNALSAGQVDICENAPLSLTSQVKNSTSLKALISAPGAWIPFTMRVDVPPFNDVRVRQAFRLLVDRPQMIASSAYGLGIVANDVFGLHDPCYDNSLKRSQDIPQAKSLLKQAGQSDLSVELVTADFTAGAVLAAQVFAQQAQAAGVTVTLRNLSVTDFFSNYLKWTFSQDFFACAPFMSIAAQTTVPNANFNETHFDDARYNSLYQQANGTLDARKRCELIKEMQSIQFTEGGYIIPSYNPTVDLMSTKVNGFGRAATGIPLGNGNWEQAWIE